MCALCIVNLYVWQSYCIILMQSLESESCSAPSHFKLLPGTSAVSVSLAYFFSWCLKIVRNNVAGCISALWTANADLAKLEQGTLGNTKLWVWPSVRGQQSWVGRVHNITCAPAFSHPFFSLTREPSQMVDALLLPDAIINTMALRCILISQ